MTGVPDRVSKGGGLTEYTLTIQESRGVGGVETCSSPHAAHHDVTYRRIRFSSDHEMLQMIFLGYRALDLVVWIQKVILV